METIPRVHLVLTAAPSRRARSVSPIPPEKSERQGPSYLDLFRPFMV